MESNPSEIKIYATTKPEDRNMREVWWSLGREDRTLLFKRERSLRKK